MDQVHRWIIDKEYDKVRKTNKSLNYDELHNV